MSFHNGRISVSLFGESHGSHIGITIHDFPHGIKLDLNKIKEDLLNRHSFKLGKSPRTEEDQFEIISGYFNEHTTGAPLTFIIKNMDIKSDDYKSYEGIVRPSHGDFTLYNKFEGFHDYRGGGHYSGRLTSLFIILGSICESELNKRNIFVSSRIKSIHNIEDKTDFSDEVLDTSFPVSDNLAKTRMIELINSLTNDSVGGIIESKVSNLPIGLGNPIFSGVESTISSLIFSIPAVKGVEFGTGFNISKMYGSEANDQMEYVDGKINYLSNNSGGISSGITNGENIIFRTAIKPTPTISFPMKTVNIKNNENVVVNYTGRHDKCIVPKVVHVINAVTCYAIYNMILGEANE